MKGDANRCEKTKHTVRARTDQNTPRITGMAVKSFPPLSGWKGLLGGSPRMFGSPGSWPRQSTSRRSRRSKTLCWTGETSLR